MYQASFVVWALASLTRCDEVNRDIFATLLNASLEIFLNKTSDDRMSAEEVSNFVKSLVLLTSILFISVSFD